MTHGIMSREFMAERVSDQTLPQLVESAPHGVLTRRAVAEVFKESTAPLDKAVKEATQTEDYLIWDGQQWKLAESW